jgi:dihydropteroate synthase
MHMQGTPATMQDDPRYTDVTREVAAFLGERRATAVAAGVADECIALDPGIGFGKQLEHNLQLLGSVSWFTRLGRPVLVGASRKGFLGKLTGGAPASDRLEASLAAAAIAAWQGAAMLRVHDVAATRRALALADAARAARPAG